MFLKTLIPKWFESVQIFKPSNLKLFLLGSLNTFIKSLTILLKNSWWIAIFLLIPFLLSFSLLFFLKFIPVVGYWIKLYNLLVSLLGFLPFVFLTFFIFLTVRSSVEKKDIRYFMSFLNSFWLFLILALLQIGFVMYVPIVAKLFPMLWISVLFFLDSKRKFNSLYYSILNGVRSLVFYFPVFIVLGLFNLGCISFSEYLLDFGTIFSGSSSSVIGYILLIIVCFLIELLFISFLNVYYIKIRHKDFHFFSHK